MRAQVILDSITDLELRAAQLAYQRTVKDHDPPIGPAPEPGTPTGLVAVVGTCWTWRSPQMTTEHLVAWADEYDRQTVFHRRSKTHEIAPRPEEAQHA